MRLSGWSAAVASIIASDNFVYVPDVDRGPIADWILTSGLTLEEAALIQPAYPWQHETAPIPDDAIELRPEWSGVFGDLRFSNFRIFRGDDGGEMPQVNVDTDSSNTFCEFGFGGCGILTPFLPLGGVDLAPRSDGTLGEPAGESADSHGSNGPGSASLVVTRNARVLIQFDVDVVSPMRRIVRRPQASALFANPFQVYGPNEITLFVSGNQSRFFIDHPADRWEMQDGPTLITIDMSPSADETFDFQPTRHLTVVTELLPRAGQSHRSQLLQFALVTIPEPASCYLLLGGAAVLAVRFRRR
jgi:hypothetical protein